jgi:hypothetical protein
VFESIVNVEIDCIHSRNGSDWVATISKMLVCNEFVMLMLKLRFRDDKVTTQPCFVTMKTNLLIGLSALLSLRVSHLSFLDS